MLRATLKSLLAHKVRLGLTGLAIVLGVAFVSGTFVYTDTINDVFVDLVDSGTSGVDIYVRGESAFTNIGNGQSSERATVPDDLLSEVADVDGVAEAHGSVSGYAQIIDEDGQAITPMGPPTLGMSWTPEPAGAFSVRDGRAPSGADEVAIDAATAGSHDLEVGERVRVVFAQVEPREFEIAGIAGYGEADNLAGATAALFDLETAQEVLGKTGELDAIEVVAAEGVSIGELQERLEATVPSAVDVAAADAVAAETTAAIEQQLAFLQIALLTFGLIALFVGAFIIANTFTIVVAQRTREFALLRALGASNRQVLASVLGEAAVVGLVASAAGVVAGLGLAAGLRELMSAVGMDMPTGQLIVQPRTIIVGLVVGVVVTVIASILPARRAARVEPVAAMRLVSTPSSPSSRIRTVVGALLTGAGLALVGVVVVASPDNGPALVGVAALLTLLGVGGLAPLVARPLTRILGAPAAKLGVPGRLAQGNAMRSPRRTAQTAAALMIGLALVSFIAVFAASTKASVSEGIDDLLKADAIVSGTNAFSGGGFSPIVAEQLREIPEVGAVSQIRWGQAAVDDTMTAVSAIDPSTWDEVASTTFLEGSVADLTADGAVMVDADAAAGQGLQVGDEVGARFAATGTTTLTVAAIYEPDALLNGGWITSVETFDEHFAEPLDVTVLLTAAEGVDGEALASAVEPVTQAFPNVRIQDQAAYEESVAGQVDSVLAMIQGLLAMAIVIAVVGIVNTLALSVHERTREIGLLRAVGMTRRQARSMIRWEGVIVAVLGALLGLAVGTTFGWAMVSTLGDDGIGRFVIPAGQLAIYVVLAAVAGVIAAVFPARRAAKLDVLRAVTVE